MSRKSVLTPTPSHLACELCGEEITHDVARVDAGRLFHLRCFRSRIDGGRRALVECPACLTLGARWNAAASTWDECQTCSGTGYLSRQ